MKVVRAFAALGLALCCVSALANTYQVEGGMSFIRDSGIGNDRLSLRGEYFFTPVLTLNHPLAEAAFLEQSPRLFVETDTDFDWMKLGGEVYLPDTMFYVGAAIVRTQDGGSETRLVATFGLVPLEGLLITTHLTDDGYDPNVRAKYLADLGGGNFVNVEAEFIDRDIDNFLSLMADFYINRSWSIGGGYADNYGDEFTLRTRKFFNNELSGEVSVTDTDWGSRVMVGGTLRF
ncbi:putative porin [Marinimicrobium sp. ABcell2]|uniref:putative porin n=1 Tax=Marinimicrobium sp. ABcell2 TaxID=3069751 RepID=UPI0027B086BF|nr:putative porin [Marinimicrobium sp. ABcell2]MDQ2077596.1 putative porin [Marinimicrobium sp. ABcell2]